MLLNAIVALSYEAISRSKIYSTIVRVTIGKTVLGRGKGFMDGRVQIVLS